jgi:hypothetical protein
VRAFYESWEPCLGRVLETAEIRLLDGQNPGKTDFGELRLTFGQTGLVRFLSCQQTETDWALSVHTASSPVTTAPVIDGKDHPILLPALGGVHTAVQLFTDDGTALKAVAFYFGAAAFAFGVGHHTGSKETGTLSFDGFQGEHLGLWTTTEFNDLLRRHPLQLACEFSVE